ncbi:chemotaxis protein CheW [Caenibacillus caldisaponilyticus]|uniref:chemotaxis protein CheW n=1 Tax=Caenibacillus caldisaponilyticus TaxID=1674942 RepID=UPI000988792E|nr:chemotaxis protein CheW [Caenibacillus caldisaponilyticus]
MMNDSAFAVENKKEQDVIVFEAHEKVLALPVRYIVEIVKPTEIKPLPLSPRAVEGVIRVRDRIYPLINAAVLLTSGETSPAQTGEGADLEEIRFILTDWNGTPAAIRADRIVTLTKRREDENTGGQKPMTDAPSDPESRYLTPVHSVDGRDFFLLDLENVITDLHAQAVRLLE